MLVFCLAKSEGKMFKLLKNLKSIDCLYIFLVAGLVVLQVWLDIKIPDYTRAITSELQRPQTGILMGHPEWTVRVPVILQNGGFMLACALGSLGSAIIVGFLTAKIAANFSFNLREKIYNKIQNFSLSELNQFSTASLITRTTNDVTQVQFFVAMGLQVLLKAPVMAIWALTKMLNVSWQWSLATGVAICLLIVMITIVVIFAIPKFKRIQTLTDNLNRVTRENLTGIRVIRAANAEDYQNAKFEKSNQELTSNNLFASRIMGIMSPGMSLIMSSLSLSIFWIGAYIVKDSNMLDFMISFMSYSVQIVMAFMLLIMIFIMLPRVLVSSRRINEVLDSKNDITSGVFEGAEDREKVPVVAFRNVSFKYPNADEYVLKDISFEANEGETVAFIGSTGSGKSTLINLIPRLYDATEGDVLIEGVNVKEYDLHRLNQKIGYVPQRGVLFKGTVKENVDFGDNKASEEVVKKAISVAQASNFVGRMGGLDSEISQGGTNVSGGQKQRLSIARAIAREPQIFIFDDSFSALDYKTDKKLREALKKHTGNATKFIVAQRIGTIKDADKIVVLDSGNMVGIGTHEELLKTCPIYKEIALSQLSKEEL